MEVINDDGTIVQVRAMWQYDRDKASDEAGVSFDPEYESEEGRFPARDMCQQQFKEECDINEIVRRFGLTGQMPTTVRTPMIGDFTGVVDYQSALNAVIKARDDFMALPGEVRERFLHDPQRLMDFMNDPKNRDEAVKIGLIPKAPEKTRDVVQAVDELAAVLKPK